MKLFRLVSLVSLALLALSASTGDAAQCKKPRVRRAWSSLSKWDRQLYKDALAAAMDSGKYIKFVEAHTEMMSEMEAHKQCMLIYWHRLFLAAFENMLRDLQPRFACVTVPYWDWMTDYNKVLTNKCTNMLNCSPTLSILGGRPPVHEGLRNVTINGATVQGYCASEYPMNHFCESSLVSGSKCLRCVPRDDWANVSLPATASFASVRAQLFQAKNIGEMSKAIEDGVHDNIHGELGGAMGFSSRHLVQSSGPVFWSHHSMVDLLHSIFHKCKVGEKKMSITEKVASVDWVSCERRNNTGIFNPTDPVVLLTGFSGIKPINATLDPLVGKYFAAVPQQYASLIDIRDLGESSYTYELQGLTNILYTECGASTETPTPTTVTSSVQQSVNVSTLPTMGAIANTTMGSSAQKVYGWVSMTDKQAKQHGVNELEEAEQKTCLFQDECLGGVTLYTEEFKQQFHISGEPRCKQVVDKLHRTTDAKQVAEWKTEMVALFGCPKPKGSTAPPLASPKPLIGGRSSNQYLSLVGQLI